MSESKRRDPSSQPHKLRRAAVAVAGPLLLAAACTHPGDTAEREPAPATTTSAPTSTTTTSTTTTTSPEQAEMERQQNLNLVVNRLIATDLKDVPEKVAKFRKKHGMTFHFYTSPGYNAPDGRPYQRILSQSPDTPKGSSKVGYSFLISYLDNPDGTRTFDHMDLFSTNNASTDPDSINNPELHGFQILNQLEIAKNDDGNWSVTLTDHAQGVDTLLSDQPADPAQVEAQAAYFTQLLNS